jgi:membrane protein implicated in regulation of membrane protease activity
MQNEFAKRRQAHSFFNIARFDPDSWFIYGLLATVALVLYAFGYAYFALVPVGAICGIFAVEASEVIHLDYPEERRLVGAKCAVVRQISKTERGVVRLANSMGNLDWETWSAESDCSFEEGNVALVSGIRGITLQVEPLN